MRFAPMTALLALSMTLSAIPAGAASVPTTASAGAAAAQGPWNPRLPEGDPVVTFLIAIAVATGAWLLIDAVLFDEDEEDVPVSP